MLPGCCKNGIIISKVPVIQAGLHGVMQLHFPEYELTTCGVVEELTPLQLRRTELAIVDLTGDCHHPRTVISIGFSWCRARITRRRSNY